MSTTSPRPGSPRGRSRAIRPSLEPLEGRIALAAGVTMLSATTTDSRSVLVTYRVDDAGAGRPVPLTIYRSATASFGPKAARVGGEVVAGADVTPGVHSVAVPVPAGLRLDPSRPDVLAVAGTAGSAKVAPKTSGDLASFRIYTIAGLSHGTDPSPVWEPATAAALKSEGYDRTVPVYWVAQSFLPVPGLAVATGDRLASKVIHAAHTLPPDAVIDLHLIGHSRGSVVISRAMQDILAEAESGLDPQLRGILAGWSLMTFLDPHPAHNVHSTTDPSAQFYSAAPSVAGRAVTQDYLRTQARIDDPEAVVPAGVAEAVVYYQHASYTRAPNPAERIFNIWGEVPIQGATRYVDLTGKVNGHYEVPGFYLKRIVPTLRTGGT